jgi:glycosyltransferase involved in cell wall biosynthesis
MKISIITVCYNSIETIEETIKSIKSQSYQNMEFIVIDGASTDNTLEVLKNHDDFISCCVSESDGGIYDAMNKGIALASGEVIGFLNADDFYSKNEVLKSVAQCFEDDPTLDACYSDLMYVERFDTSRTLRYWQSNGFVPGAFSRGWCPPHPTFFVRRSIYERFGGFDLSYRIAADVELMMRFLEVHKIRVKHVLDVWVKMRMGGTTNKSLHNVWVQNREILRALKSHGLPANPLRFFANKLWSRGKQFLQRPEE